jgi:hypothetical protein
MTDTPRDQRQQPPWHVPIRLEDVPEGGRHIDLQPDEQTRGALAAFTGLRALPSATASFDVQRHGRDGLRVTGEVRAVAGQTCVVSLEPMESEIHEPVDVVFRPAAAVAPAGEPAPDTEEDPPELLVDGTADLGVLATEFLILGIDPYPRKPGAVFEPPPAGPAEAGPFAALARLKGGPRREK